MRNEEDGSVLIVCEGERENIEKLVKGIDIEQYPIKVRDISIEYSEATGEFDEFEIVREEDLTQAVYERMDTAARYMQEMNIDLGEKIDVVGENVGQNIEETRKVHEETRAFRADTVECFDRPDDKYHIVSENLKAMNRELLESRKELTRLVDHIGLLVKDHIENEERASSA